jgi:hypothetical protein
MGSITLLLALLASNNGYDQQARSATVSTLAEKAAQAIIDESKTVSKNKAFKAEVESSLQEELREIKKQLSDLKEAGDGVSFKIESILNLKHPPKSNEELVPIPDENFEAKPSKIESIRPLQVDPEPIQKPVKSENKPKLPALFYNGALSSWSWPGDLRQHMQGGPHYLDKDEAETMAMMPLIKLHENLHNGVNVPYKKTVPPKTVVKTPNNAATRTYVYQGGNGCPGGVCPSGVYRFRRGRR